MRSLAAASGDPGSALWYFSRATGAVSLLLLTAVVVLGVLIVRGQPLAGLPRFVVSGLHRNVSLLAMVLLAAHVLTSVLDPFAPIGLADAVLPFAAAYRPLWLGLGAAGLDILLAIVVTSLLRVRTGQRVWRATHWLTVVAWPVAVLHGLGTGSDTRRGWMLALTAACVLAAAGAVLWRARTASGDRTRRATAAVLAVGLPVALVAWVRVGPLAPDWARRSGTPASLLARPGATPSATPTTAATGPPRGSGSVNGPAQARSTRRGFDVLLVGSVTGQWSGQLRVLLHERPVGDEGFGQVTGGDVRVTSTAGTYSGALSGVNGDQYSAVLDGPGGQIRLDAELGINLQSGAFQGSVETS